MGSRVPFVALVSCVALAGCGRFGIDAVVQRDATVDDATPPLADVPPDGAPDVDAAIAAACGATVLLDDPLDDGMPAPGFTTLIGTGLTLLETGGGLEIAYAASVPADQYGTYRSAAAYTADGLCVTLEISEVPANGGAAFLKLRTAQLEVEFFGYSGMLELRTRQSNAVAVRNTIPLDLVGARFWRLRQQGGTTFWDTSADGISYVARDAVAGFFNPASCQIEFGAGAVTATSNGGRARYERVILHGP